MSSQSVQNLTRGIIRENPTFVMLLGMCPTLGVTTSAGNGLGMGLGFTLGLTSLGIVREILGSYSVFGWSFAGEGTYPLLLFIMPPGAFIALAGLIIVFNKLRGVK